MKKFQNKKILIVGASQGIGRALALQLGRLDCQLFLLSRNEEALIELCEIINTTRINNTSSSGSSAKENSNFNRARYAICDVSNRDEVKSSVEKVSKELGKIDIAVINSGVNGSEGFDDFNSDIFKKIYDVNIYGILYFLEYLIPLMKLSGGGIIAGVSSLADVRGFPGSGAYSSSKAAVSSILEAAHLELSRFNIKVLTIKPGFVKTNMTNKNLFPMPFIISAEKAANYIIKGLKKEKVLIAFPFITKIASDFGKILPKRVFNLIFNKRNFKF